MDKRIKYYAVLDTETCNSLEEPLVYDLAFKIVDKKGRVYEEHSFLIKEIFFKEQELMKSSYYAEKIPKYLEKIRKREIKVISFYEARKILVETMKKWNCNTVCAYNARFDVNALNTTQRWLTKSKYRYFFPFGVEIWDILKMANDTICKQKMYNQFCKDNNFLTKHKYPQNRKTAEVVYRYLTYNVHFIESHTALEDVSIETEIMACCFRQHKKMRKKLWENRERGVDIF